MRIEAQLNAHTNHRRQAFIPYLTAGDTSLEATEQLILELELVRRVRKQSEVPIVLFSYLNPLSSIGIGRLGEGLASAGVGPEHAYLHDIGRLSYSKASDDEALEAFQQ